MVSALSFPSTLHFHGPTQVASPLVRHCVAISRFITWPMHYRRSRDQSRVQPVIGGLSAARAESGWSPPLTPLPTPDCRRSEEHTSELQSRGHLVCRLLLEKKKEELYSSTLDYSTTANS